MEEILEILPQEIRDKIIQNNIVNNLEEIRIRIDRPIELVTNGVPIYIALVIQNNHLAYIIGKLTQYSIYMMEEELKRGYITIKGGHRIGLAGKVVTEGSKVKLIRDITSLNIRLAKEKNGIANELITYLYEKKWHNSIIIGPPQTGKTTMIRDIARIISSGIREENIQAYKVGIVDERSEIAGCVDGIPQFTFGVRLDVLDACPKAEGMMMMIRSMSPEVLIVDEIGREEDVQAISEAINAGVQVIVSVHGYDLEDLKKREAIKKLLDLNVFKRFIILSRENGPGTINRILNQDGKDIKNIGIHL